MLFDNTELENVGRDGDLGDGDLAEGEQEENERSAGGFHEECRVK